MNTVLKRRIMRRVWAIYLARKAVSPIAVQTYVVSFFIVQLFVLVSLPHIVANMPSIARPGAFLSFYAQSFLETEPIVQIVAVGLLTSIAWFVRHIVRNVGEAGVKMRAWHVVS